MTTIRTIFSHSDLVMARIFHCNLESVYSNFKIDISAFINKYGMGLGYHNESLPMIIKVHFKFGCNSMIPSNSFDYQMISGKLCLFRFRAICYHGRINEMVFNQITV